MSTSRVFPSLRTLLVCTGFIGICCANTRGAEAAGPPALPPFPLWGAKLAPSLKAAADRDHVLLYNLDPLDAAPAIGDSMVAWIGTRQGDHIQQWLVEFRRGTTTEKERKNSNAKSKTKYLSWGDVVTFQSDQEPIELWIAGPVDLLPDGNEKPGATVAVQRNRVVVPGNFLRLGLDNSARVDLHLTQRQKELTKEDPAFKMGHIYALDQPVKPEKIREAKPIAEKLGFTPAMSRAWIGGHIALQVFYEVAEEVPPLRDIALVAVEKPSLFKLAKLATGSHFRSSFGGLNNRAVDPKKLGLMPVELESFDAPFEFGFDNKIIVSGALLVTSPQPPLDVSAGILALIAIHPTDHSRQVQVVMISSRRGETPAVATGSH